MTSVCPLIGDAKFDDVVKVVSTGFSIVNDLFPFVTESHLGSDILTVIFGIFSPFAGVWGTQKRQWHSGNQMPGFPITNLRPGALESLKVAGLQA